MNKWGEDSSKRLQGTSGLLIQGWKKSPERSARSSTPYLSTHSVCSDHGQGRGRREEKGSSPPAQKFHLTVGNEQTKHKSTWSFGGCTDPVLPGDPTEAGAVSLDPAGSGCWHGSWTRRRRPPGIHERRQPGGEWAPGPKTAEAWGPDLIRVGSARGGFQGKVKTTSLKTGGYDEKRCTSACPWARSKGGKQAKDGG